MEHAQIDILRQALAQDNFKPSSDFDLNPEVISQLPPNRVIRPAAVLVPVVQRSSGVRVILTKRSSHLKHHPGQVAFPGGKQDADDADLAATALREAHEEIGLQPSHVELIGSLSAHQTVTNFDVSPFVGLVDPDFSAVPEVGEVEEVFEVPLAFLTDLRNMSVEGRVWRGQKRHFYTIPYGPYYIWGATARMLRGLAERVAACA